VASFWRENFLEGKLLLPDHCSYEVLWSKDFVQEHPRSVDLVVVNAHPKASVLPQELVQKPQPGVHHGKPLVVPGEVFGLRAHHLP
jgi:hypothetical protein